MELRTSKPHPKCQEIISKFNEHINPGSRNLTVGCSRRLSDELYYGVDDRETLPGEVEMIQDLSIPGPDRNEVPIRVYVPDIDEPAPALVWFHGGGWVVGGLDSVDPTCRLLATESEYVVISVSYRLAPEHPFPAALRDCHEATRWVVQNAKSLNADPKRIAIGGQSAGGNLAAAVGLLMRDQEAVDEIDHQVLVYPVIDCSFNRQSYEEMAEGYALDRVTMKWFWNQYLEHDLDKHHPYACPIRAKDLSGLPPATVVTAGFDVLRDEGIAYAEQLEEEGVDVTLRNYEDMIHGFFAWHIDPKIDQGRKAIGDVATDLHENLGK